MEDLLGIVYKKNGRLPDGLDCYSLVQEVCRRRGISLPEYDSPTEDSLIHMMITGEMYKYVEEINQPEPYCFVTFALHGPYVTHIGIVLDDTRYFLHILEHRNVAKERLDNRYWKQKIIGLYKWNKPLTS